MTTSITQAELLDALAQAARGHEPEDALTTNEMAEAAGVQTDRIRAALKQVQREGRLTPHKVRRVGIDGRAALVVAYTIAPAKRVAARKRGV